MEDKTMKKTFLKFLPVVAAVLLATSCSKDNDGDNTVIDNPETPVENNESTEPKSEPLTMTFKASTSANLIAGDEESGTTIEPKFGADDVIKLADASNLVTAEVTLTAADISEDGKSADFTVSSFIGSEENLAKFKSGEIKLIATIGAAKLTDIDETAYTSLESAIRAKSYQQSEAISYSSEKVNITFSEQNAYLEVFMSPDQHVVTINNHDYTMDANGKVWIAVGVGTNVSANFLNEQQIENAQVYTIDRSGLVDLGISDGILWADANVTGGTGTNKDGVWYYTFDQANGINGQTSPVSAPLEIPKGGNSVTYNPNYPNTDINNLSSQCYWEKVMDGSTFKGYNVFQKKGGDSPTYSSDSDPHIFLSAAGLCRGGEGPNLAGINGALWSSTELDEGVGFGLGFSSDGVDTERRGQRYFEMPVRAVRRK